MVPGIVKLVELAASGLGAVAGPMLANWRARQEGQAQLTSAEFRAAAKMIDASSEVSSTAMIAEARADAVRRIRQAAEEPLEVTKMVGSQVSERVEFQERKRLANIRAVLEGAADMLDDREVEDHVPDPDWAARFFECAQDISRPEMQRLWAHLLANEVEKPGEVSLRTLETLRNLTSEEAQLFAATCEYVIDGRFILLLRDSEEMPAALTLSSLLALQDCGLVQVQKNLVNRVFWEEGVEGVQVHPMPFHSGTLILEKGASTPKETQIPVAPLTVAGRDLFSVTEPPNPESGPDMAYLSSLASVLTATDCSLSYTTADGETSKIMP